MDPTSAESQPAPSSFRPTPGGNPTAVFKLLFERHNQEINGFVTALVRSDDASAEVCAQVWEDVWRGLPAFRGDASHRTWLYTLARNACFRFRTRSPRRRECSLSEVRTSRLVYSHPTRPSITETRRERLERLRSELSDDEQALLILRIDRGLAWEDIARVFQEDSDGEAGGSLERSCAALRKRFERLKDRLRTKLREDEA